MCFYTGTSTFSGNWIARGNTAPAYGSYGMNSGTNKFNQNLWNNNGDGYLQVTAKNGSGHEHHLRVQRTDERVGNRWC